MSGAGRRHERFLLDALGEMEAEAFAGDVWRVVGHGREPLRGSAAGGRWSPPGEFEVLYTSLDATGALAEIGYRLSLEPVWPSCARHDLHRIEARTRRTLRFADVRALAPLGVDIGRYAGFGYAGSQALAAAARFLEFDGLVVPSARSSALNIVVFLDGLSIDALVAIDAGPVDWAAWRSQR